MKTLTAEQKTLLARIVCGGDVRLSRHSHPDAEQLLTTALVTFDYSTCRYLATDSGRRALQSSAR